MLCTDCSTTQYGAQMFCSHALLSFVMYHQHCLKTMVSFSRAYKNHNLKTRVWRILFECVDSVLNYIGLFKIHYYMYIKSSIFKLFGVLSLIIFIYMGSRLQQVIVICSIEENITCYSNVL